MNECLIKNNVTTLKNPHGEPCKLLWQRDMHFLIHVIVKELLNIERVVRVNLGNVL